MSDRWNQKIIKKNNQYFNINLEDNNMDTLKKLRDLVMENKLLVASSLAGVAALAYVFLL